MIRVKAIWSRVSPKLATYVRSSRRSYSSSLPPKIDPKSSLYSRFLQGASVGVAGGLTLGIYSYLSEKTVAHVDAEALSPLGFEVDLQPPTNLDPFPQTISINKVPFQCLGTGVRSVTFVSFHVYAAGIYIANDDIPLARKILRQAVEESEDHDLAAILQDVERSEQVIDTLLRENVRLAVRIVPTRTTDFSHLRDGFVRSVTGHSQFNTVQSPEVGMALGEIKKAFSRKRKMKKGEVVTWARDVSGGMSAWFGESDTDKELLGSPSDADVARLFYLRYLSGKNPNSPTLKERTIAGLVNLGER